MRIAFIETLSELAASDDRIFLLTADLGWSVVEKFAARYPKRFLNVGVAEANMAGVAAGLAMAGYVPYLYSIATFTSMRCYEQVRNGALLHHLPVRVVGIGGGYAYGHGGPTHFALEDLAISRAQPGMTVLAPADPAQTRSVIKELQKLKGPAYIRVGKGGDAEIPNLHGRFAFGRPELVRQGRHVLFVICGSIGSETLKAAAQLEQEGISAAIAVQAHVGFAASPELVSLLKSFPHVVTVEEGFASGGLGSLISETVAQEGLRCRVQICGIKRSFGGPAGSQAYMRAQAGLDSKGLAAAARKLLSVKAP